MTYIRRLLSLDSILKTRSVFLLGPRQTGKSSYLKNQLTEPADFVFNLLDQKIFFELSQNLTLMRERILETKKKNVLVVIDEVQRLPEILNEVHLLIEDFGVRFILTGSSARKLKRQGVNLLGGRGRDRIFHPFVYLEVKDHGFDLEKSFETGLIPNHFSSDSPKEDLLAYTGRYLSEEIASEALTRNIAAFARFLEFAAICNGQLINFSSLASDTGIARSTVQNYFSILKDTLIAKELPPFTKTLKRKSIETSKFYFFDMGIVHFLKKLGAVSPGSKDYGDFFEHFIYCELSGYISYFRQTATLKYWRSTAGHEVDFILDDSIAIEVKSSSRIQSKHLAGLKALGEEKLSFRYFILVCMEDAPRQLEDGILILPWKIFLERLWNGDFSA